MSTITCNEHMKGNAKCKIIVLSHPLADLGVTHSVHLWLHGKRIVDFQLAIIKLFFAIALTAAALLLSVTCRNRRFLKERVSLQRLRSATRHQLIVPRHRCSGFRRRAFSVADPMVWNLLPDHLRDPSLSIGSFRSALKIFLLTTCRDM